MKNIRIEELGIRILGRVLPAQVFAQSSVRVSKIQNPKSSKGFTLLELIVVISIVAIMAGVFLSRVPFYQEQAEKTVMEQMAGAMQSALVMRYGSMLAQGSVTEKDLKALATSNPMEWLQKKPGNYAGEYFAPTPKTVAPGHWMFDLKSRDLIYVLDRSEYFTPGKDGHKWIRFHVKLEYEPGSKNKQEPVATLFEPTVAYRWFN
ncbi:MAG: type II secretion system protein [Sideroxyarcus sp.]|nr:type II secretion system protein [Sideroxyarcus sp.]